MSFSSFAQLHVVVLGFSAVLACIGCSSGGSQSGDQLDMRMSQPGDGGVGADGSPSGSDLAAPPVEGRLLSTALIGGSSAVYGFAAAADKNGNRALGGAFGNLIDFGPDSVTAAGDLDGFFVVYNADGKQRFHRTFGNTQEDRVGAMAFDSLGNLIVVGWLREQCDLGTGPIGMAGTISIFVAKYSPDGTPLWTRAYSGSGSSSGWAWAVAVDSSDNIVVAGQLTGTADFGGGPLSSGGASNVLLFKLNASGSHIFSKRFGGAVGGDNYGFAVAIAGNGDVLLTGSVYAPVDFGGGMLSGDKTSAFIARFSAIGSYRWARRLGPMTNSYSESLGVAVDGSGEVVITGKFTDDLDCGGAQLHSPALLSMFLARYTADGASLSSRQISGTGDISPVGGLRIDSRGNLIVGGAFSGEFAFPGGPILTFGGFNDAFLAKLAPDGTHLFSRRYGETQLDVVRNVAVDAQDNILAAGQFAGTVDFGGGPVSSDHFSSEAFLIKLSP